MSYQTPTPRRSRDLPPAKFAVLFALLCLAVFATIQWLSGCERVADASDEKPTITHDSMCATYTYDGEIVRWYVLVDPDEGVQYLYNDHSWVATPRMNRNGEQMGTLEERGQ